MPYTMLEKVWSAHEIASQGSRCLLYVDRHYVHEVTSPQAFEGLRQANRRVRRPDLTVATMDHDVPTSDRSLPIIDETAAAQMAALRRNCTEFGVNLYGLGDPNQGIVHVIGPQLGMTIPGATIVCGDSHTSTHGAFGALGFGIGTSDVEHVLASQTVWMERPQPMRITVSGSLGAGRLVTAKDVILSIIRKIGTGGGAGHVIEYAGDAISDLSMEERMTICNMSIEAGARAGMIAPDDTTYDYVRGKKFCPPDVDELVIEWDRLKSDDSAKFAKEARLDASDIAPQVSWGTNPSMTCDVTEEVPDPAEYARGDEMLERSAQQALEYMDLSPGTPIADIRLDRVFIGSCTNARLGDLEQAARAVSGHTVAEGVRAMVVPGSQQVKAQAEERGLDKIFTDAGFEWRESGCSMCLGMNPDVLSAGERCASTSNRNFEGRQGAGGRTHLVSPIMAAAAAVAGRFVDVREALS